MLVHTYLNVFELLGMQSTSQQQLLLVPLSIDFSKQPLLFQLWYVKISLTFLIIIHLKILFSFLERLC